MFHLKMFLKPQTYSQPLDSQVDLFVPTGQQDPYDKTGSNNNTVEVSFLTLFVTLR